MELSPKQRMHLKALAHHRQTSVRVGNPGVTSPVVKEIMAALAQHELIKVRLPGVARDDRAEMLRQIGEATGASTVQVIGRVVIIYLQGQKPQIVLPTD